MKRYFSLYMFLSIVIFSCNSSISDEVTVVTYNIRYDSPNDRKNLWQHRKKRLMECIKSINPDIIGIQEGLKHQLDYIEETLNNFQIVGLDRDNNLNGEFSSILFNSNQFELISTKTFWLSETPNIPSKSWDSAYPRICTYPVLQHKDSKESIYIFNTHLDHLGTVSRINSSKLILNKIKAIAPKYGKIILMGDFNDSEVSETIFQIKNYLDDGKAIADKNINTQHGTYNGFDINSDLKYRLDYIFFKNTKVISYEHKTGTLKNDLWPSDHLPVVASFVIKY